MERRVCLLISITSARPAELLPTDFAVKRGSVPLHGSETKRLRSPSTRNERRYLERSLLCGSKLAAFGASQGVWRIHDGCRMEMDISGART